MLTTFLTVFVVSYFWHMLGITVGYHRLLSHRSFRCPKWVEYFWVISAYLGCEPNPIFWITTHRAHHRYTDLPADPHSLKHRGWKHAYFGWFLEKTYPAYMNPNKLAKDLVSDPLYRWLDQGGDWHASYRLCAYINFAFRLALFLCFGWVVAAASYAAAIVVQQVPLLLNVVCHIPSLGYKNFDTDDDSVNVWWVSFLTTGEGWHNNHHAFPGSARHGFKPHEIDPAWITISIMKMMGLVSWAHEESMTSTFKRPPLPEMPVMDGPNLFDTAVGAKVPVLSGSDR